MTGGGERVLELSSEREQAAGRYGLCRSVLGLGFYSE